MQKAFAFVWHKKKWMMKKYLPMMLTLISTSVFAQNNKDTLRSIELPATVIKEYKQNLKDEAVTKKVDPKLMQRLNQASDLPYVLNAMSNVVVTSDAGTGTGYTGIRVRGADLTRINVTMNGVPVNDPESQATYFVDMPDLLSSTQAIELTKGVGNSTNGNASFGAAIAIHNLDVQDLKAHASYRIDYGTFNSMKNTVRLTTGLINQHLIATFRASSISSDGYIDRSASALKALQGTFKYIVNPNTQLVFNYVKGKEKTGQAWDGVPQDSLATNRQLNYLGIRSDGTYYENQTDNYQQDYYQFFADHHINNHFTIGSTLFYTKGKGYYEEYWTEQKFSDYGLPNFIRGNDTMESTDLARQIWLDNDFYGGRLYLNYFSKKIDAGLYLNYNEYKGKHFGDIIWADYGVPNGYQWYHLTAQKNDANIYGMLDYKLSAKLNLFADLQYRQVHYTLNGFRHHPAIRHDLMYHFFNPKLKLTYTSNKTISSLLVGIAQKEPNRDDIEASASSVPKPEKLFDVEWNEVYSPNRHWALYATAFLMYYQDQLVLTGKLNDVGAYTRTNIPESYRTGIELEAAWKPACRYVEVKGNIALSENKITQFDEYLDDYDNGGQVKNSYTKTDISFSPNVVASATVSVFPMKGKWNRKTENLSIDILPKYVGKQYLDNTQNPDRILKSYFVNDVMIHCPLPLQSGAKLILRTGIYNVFNHLYESNGASYSYFVNQKAQAANYYYPQAGRRWMLGIGVEF